jgi:hypothetical protein
MEDQAVSNILSSIPSGLIFAGHYWQTRSATREHFASLQLLISVS